MEEKFQGIVCRVTLSVPKIPKPKAEKWKKSHDLPSKKVFSLMGSKLVFSSRMGT